MLFLFPFQHIENGKHSNISIPQTCSNTNIFIQKFKRSSSEAGVGAFQHSVAKGRGSMRATNAGLLRRTSLTRHCPPHVGFGRSQCAYWEMNCKMLSIFKRHAGLPRESETQLAVRASGWATLQKQKLPLHQQVRTKRKTHKI